MVVLAKRLSRSYRVARRIAKYWILKLKHQNSIQDICDIHFRYWSLENHINRTGLTRGILALKAQNPIIFETGTSAYGVDSSRLFDRIASRLSGTFISVDINPQPKYSLLFQHSRRSEFFVEDSVTFIKSKLPELVEHVDLCYLDSWDVDWSQPSMAEAHGVAEFVGVHHLLPVNSILMIDDTPKRLELIPREYQAKARDYQIQTGRIPGKGSLVLLHDFFVCYEIIYHEYNMVAIKRSL